MRTLSELAGVHKGEDIYVIGSGASLSYVDPAFFVNKITVCINAAVCRIPESAASYVVSKEPTKRIQDAAKEYNAKLVTCAFKYGANQQRNILLYPDITYLFTPKIECVLDKEQADSLELSASTIVTGMHFAAVLGARAIILVGHDCGELNGEAHVEGYDKSRAVVPTEMYGDWMRRMCIEYRSLKMKSILADLYNIPVHSLNPFINFNLEGNNFKSYYNS